MSTAFDQLVDLLGGRLAWPTIKDSSVGIRMVERPPAGFVPPTLVFEGEPGHSSVILLSAPAAVGKSTTAAALAAATGAPLWDLANVNVGANSFVGGVLNAFGPEDFGSVSGRLRNRSVLLVVDALDEAHLRSGIDNLDAFLKDLADTVRGGESRPCIVLLARIETAVVVQLMLMGHGLEPSVGRLEYFDEESALHFLDKHLELHWARLRRAVVHRQNPAVYRQVVDGVFGFIYSCFSVAPDRAWQDEQIRQFLGYAPVLEAISNYLAVENLQTIVSELDAARVDALGAGESGPWRFLMAVINRVIERERQKVIGQNLKPMLTAVASEQDWTSWDELYRLDEQVDRVLRRFFRVSLFSDQMPIIPAAIRDEYERALDPVADQHPFLTDSRLFANLVFQEYSYAWGLMRGSRSVRDTVRGLIREGSYLSSPLLGRFMLGLGGDDPVTPEIRGEDLGILYESLASGAAREGAVLLWVVSSGENGTIGHIAHEDDSDQVAFRLRNSEAPVELLRRIAHADISVEGGVSLGVARQSFSVGPDVMISTDIIETSASEYVILGDDDSYCRLEADANVSTSTDVRLKVYSTGSFEVSWEPLLFPWHTYGVPPWEEAPDLEVPFRDLVSIVKMFRRHGRDDYARKKELIDNVVVGRKVSQRTMGTQRLLNFMLERGVLEDGQLYVLRLDQLGMSWTDVREHRMTAQAAEFLTDFVSQSS